MKPMTIKAPKNEGIRDKLDGVPVVQSKYDHARWHMFHDVTYMYTRKEDKDDDDRLRG